MNIIQPAHAQATNLSQEYAFGSISSLGQGIGYLTGPTFSIAMLAVIFYLLIGGFTFLTSGGDKGKIDKGRKMIIHSIGGFLLLMLMYMILQFLPAFFGFGNISLIGN